MRRRGPNMARPLGSLLVFIVGHGSGDVGDRGHGEQVAAVLLVVSAPRPLHLGESECVVTRASSRYGERLEEVVAGAIMDFVGKGLARLGAAARLGEDRRLIGSRARGERRSPLAREGSSNS